MRSSGTATCSRSRSTFLLLGRALNIALGGGLLFRKLSAFLLAAIPLLMLLGFVRAVALVRRGTGASWSDALGAFMIWQSTSLVVARASVQALFARKAEFLRTPKTSDEARLATPSVATLPRLTLALLGVAGIGIVPGPCGHVRRRAHRWLLVLPTARSPARR